MEIWKDVKDYEGLYKVSNLGNVKSLERNALVGGGGKRVVKEKILKQTPNSCGYLSVSLNKEGKKKTITVHRLVAISFLDHTPNGYKIIIDHKDNNRVNNNPDNLQLITQRKNTSKDKKGGSSKYVGVSRSKHAEKWSSSIRINGKSKHLGYFKSELEASKAYQKALKSI